ncbi:MAG: insulinase family protein, partial [Bacteroidia bacterium]|nr:insulinase family protein [Bacteroidia bacterium]
TVTLDEIKDFFFRFYAPNNATLVVAGPVKTKEIEILAQKWFGPISAREVRRPAYAVEPPQTDIRYEVLENQRVPFAAVYKAYLIPRRGTDEYIVADFLTDLLANGKSSILYQRLVKEKKIASSINAFTWGASSDPGMLSIDARLTEGTSIEQYETALQQCIDELTSISSEAIQRMKQKLEASVIFQRTNLMNIALEIAMADHIGSVNWVNDSLPKLLSLDTQTVRDAAAKYLSPVNCATLCYLPQS